MWAKLGGGPCIAMTDCRGHWSSSQTICVVSRCSERWRGRWWRAGEIDKWREQLGGLNRRVELALDLVQYIESLSSVSVRVESSLELMVDDQERTSDFPSLCSQTLFCFNYYSIVRYPPINWTIPFKLLRYLALSVTASKIFSISLNFFSDQLSHRSTLSLGFYWVVMIL